jgi:predicted Holliday junction resolvase-like endonuclease
MILILHLLHYKLLLQLQCVQVQLNFSMNQRLRIHYRRRNRKRHFVHASGINAEELREGDRVSYEEEEGRKGKVAASSSYLNNLFLPTNV